MRIDSITLHHIAMPLISPFETSFGITDVRECIIVSIESEGEKGWGECSVEHDPGYNYETIGTAWHILKDFIAPLFLGRNIDDASSFQHQVKAIRGHHLAKAGIEMAFWDLIGKREGKSLRDLLGGLKEQVLVGVSVGIQNSPNALVKRIQAYLSDGYCRIKMKIKPGRDVGDVKAVRKAFPTTLLQVDANSAYTMETAQALMPLDDLNLSMIEQPLIEDDLWDHHKLQTQFRTPICLDESITSPNLAHSAIEMGACRIINIKSGRVGGLSQAKLIHDICLLNNLPVWCGGMLETGVGRAANLALASLPGFTMPGDISATNRYYERDITEERFVLEPGSKMSVPTGAGLGVTIDPLVLKMFQKTELRIEPQ